MASPTTLGGVGMAAIGSFPIGGSADPFKPGTLLFLDGRNLVEDNRFQANSLELNDVIGAGDVLEFLHQVLAGGDHIKPGQRVILRQDTVNIFLGSIDRLNEVKVGGGGDALFTQVEAVDLTSILDRRLITAAETYTNQTAGFIVKDLVTKYLTDEGITTNSVQTGPTLTTFSIKAFTSVGKALRNLGDRTAFISFVDSGADLHFEAQTAVVAPFELATVGEEIIILIAPDGGRWRVDVTDAGILQTVSVASGGAVSVNLRADDAGVWKLKVDNAGALQTESSSGLSTFGWRLVSSGKKIWLLRVTNAGILTTSDRDVSGALDPIRMTQSREKYRNRQTIRFGSDLALSVTRNDLTEQAARRAVEGGSGIYHAVQDEGEITTSGEATALADALLRRFKIPTSVRFSTRRRGLKAGQSIVLTFPEHGVSGTHLIDGVSARDDGTDQLRWDITALSGEHLGDVMEFWRRLFLGE